MNDLLRADAADLAALIAAGEVSAREVTAAHLDQIAAVDDRVQRLPVRGRRACPGRGRRGRRAPAAGDDARPAGRRPAGDEGHLHDDRAPRRPAGRGSSKGWMPPVQLHDHREAAGCRRGRAGQDQHGRVRDGLLHRELRLLHHPQPVGHVPDPRRFRRRLGRGAGRLRGSAGHRHRHRRLDPPAGLGHRDGGRQADLRRHVALRRGGDGVLARHPGPVRAHGAGRGPAAQRDRRLGPSRLHLDQRPRARRGRRRSPGRRHRA